jgi:hypothetical protein
MMTRQITCLTRPSQADAVWLEYFGLEDGDRFDPALLSSLRDLLWSALAAEANGAWFDAPGMAVSDQEPGAV